MSALQHAEYLEHFLHLPSEKQHKIIDAALYSFGRNGYKKASVADIAKAAGISKPMVFHYFGSKKNLYMYLLDFCGSTLASGVMSKFDKSETDFFKAVRNASVIKTAVLKEYPDIMHFIESMYFETDPEVEQEIKKVIQRGKGNFDIGRFFENVDYSRFKDGVNPALVMKLLVYFSEGVIRENPQGQKLDIESLMKQFDECLELFRKNFYKEEI
ncbi:MAG: TetR/AcrR family transcriptional regulator [Oscillospiraceae bacterium]|nr:TetR/AcrR family transcriptional regulator [Oscillospiraceae bacterium]